MSWSWTWSRSWSWSWRGTRNFWSWALWRRSTKHVRTLNICWSETHSSTKGYRCPSADWAPWVTKHEDIIEIKMEKATTFSHVMKLTFWKLKIRVEIHRMLLSGNIMDFKFSSTKSLAFSFYAIFQEQPMATFLSMQKRSNKIKEIFNRIFYKNNLDKLVYLKLRKLNPSSTTDSHKSHTTNHIVPKS